MGIGRGYTVEFLSRVRGEITKRFNLFIVLSSIVQPFSSNLLNACSHVGGMNASRLRDL